MAAPVAWQSLAAVLARPVGGCLVSRSFTCRAVITGCPDVFVGVEDDDILRQLAVHATVAPGIDPLPPDMVMAVVASISSVPQYLANAFERLRVALPAQRSAAEPARPVAEPAWSAVLPTPNGVPASPVPAPCRCLST